MLLCFQNNKIPKNAPIIHRLNKTWFVFIEMQKRCVKKDTKLPHKKVIKATYTQNKILKYLYHMFNLLKVLNSNCSPSFLFKILLGKLIAFFVEFLGKLLQWNPIKQQKDIKTYSSLHLQWPLKVLYEPEKVIYQLVSLILLDSLSAYLFFGQTWHFNVFQESGYSILSWSQE